MSLQRSFLMVLVMVALPCAATQALARGDGARARALRTPEDDAQMRELLGKLAAASGERPPEERTEADMMYEAMLRWNGEPAGSAAIDRLLESSKKEAARTKKATVDKVRSMFWKDPFSMDPQKLVPVRQEDRDLLDAYDRKNRRAEARQTRAPRESEVSRLRAEVEAARAEAAEARAEAERLRERTEAMSERRECVADNDTRAEVRRRRRSFSRPSPSHRHAEQTLTQVAMAPTSSVERYQPAPPPPPPAPAPASVPAHGIIIVPLPSPPPPPPVEKGRRSRSSHSLR